MSEKAARLPHAVLFDIGMTVIHPSGEILVEELQRSCILGITPRRAQAALAAAAEAHHHGLRSGMAASDQVGATWGWQLGIPSSMAIDVWRRCATHPDLYRRELDPDAATVLARLRAAGLRLAAVSNSDGSLPSELAALGLADAFDAVLDSALEGCEKPDGGIFAEALQHLDCLPQDACFVGDGIVNDMLGALRAGIRHVVLYDRHGLHPSVPLPTVRRLGQLPALLLPATQGQEEPCASAW